MEYYAKSRQKILTQGEIDKVKNELEDLIMNLEGEFTETDLKIIRNNISHLQDTEEEGQKTLKEHQNDIVKCAELFFEEYGEYFTEKEKCLVIEACRMHDWGKANLIFQGLVNSAQVKEQYSDIGRITQIPHGFLSAVTISRNEFKKLSELFSEADFRPFITAVYHHHDREDIYEGDEIQEYAAKYYAEQISEYLKKDIKKLYCSNQNKLLYRNNSYACETPIEPKMWEEYLLIKGLLNKFDYTVSAGYERAEIAPDLREKKLKKNIEVYLQNKELRPAQKFMMEHRNENLVVVAPTGSGKTEAALLWLNGEKGFYTLPLKVSSNAIYSRIKNNYSYENVALLHSDSMAKRSRDALVEKAGKTAREKHDRITSLLYTLKSDKKNAENKLRLAEMDLEHANKGIERHKTALAQAKKKYTEALKEKWDGDTELTAIRGEEFDPVSAICPTCGQALPEEQAETAKRKFEFNKQSRISKKLGENVLKRV